MLNRAAQSRVPVTRDITFPAPTKGWVKSGNIVTAGPDQAEVLDNFFPTAQGVRLRGGYTDYAAIGVAVRRLFVHSSGTDTLFASTDAGIYNADRINLGGAVSADVYGLAGGDWSTVSLSTAGGQFTLAMNGTDFAHYYDGTNWWPITTEAIFNVPYDALSAAFTVGETVTGGTSGATATIHSIVQTSATAGTLRVGAITGGPYQDNEALTSAAGAATANGASSAGSTITVTNIDTPSLNQCWLFKERIFAIEENSLSAWYLPIQSAGGAATEIPLGALFKRGGRLLFGATWSLDSGSGLDDVCLFVTDRGEVAVYQGTDPSSASTWALQGVYEIDAPLNKHAYFKAGGDLAVLTSDGIIPISEALRKDRAALQAVAISYPIEDAWKEAIANRSAEFPFTATLWQSQAFLIIGVPGSDNVAYVANARTGAWCRYTGWDVRCSAVANDLLYFASNDGTVRKAENGGTDGGTEYTGRYVPKFTDFGNSTRKMAMHAGITVKASQEPIFGMSAFKDYQIGTYPAITPLNTASGSTWGVGVWGTFVWGGNSTKNTYTRWKAVSASGYSLAPVVVTSSNQTEKPTFEILATRLRFETARSF